MYLINFVLLQNFRRQLNEQMSNESFGDTRSSRERYRKSWLKHPVFRSWMVEKYNQAYCKFCLRPVTGTISHMKRHNDSEKHKRLWAAGNMPDEDQTRPTDTVELKQQPQTNCDDDAVDNAEPVDRTASRTYKFNARWMEHPGLKQWMVEKNGKAYCKFCKRSVTGSIAHMRRHTETTHHKAVFSSINVKMAESGTQLPDASESSTTLESSRSKSYGFQARWLDYPDLKKWMIEKNGQAYCTFCSREVLGVMVDMVYHEDSAEHKRNHRMFIDRQCRDDADAVQGPSDNHFRAHWLRHPEMKAWIQEKNGLAYCRYCSASVAGSLNHVLKHAKSKMHRHKRNLKKLAKVKIVKPLANGGEAGKEDETEPSE